jgi:hypothetical protein
MSVMLHFYGQKHNITLMCGQVILWLGSELTQNFGPPPHPLRIKFLRKGRGRCLKVVHDSSATELQNFRQEFLRRSHCGLVDGSIWKSTRKSAKQSTRQSAISPSIGSAGARLPPSGARPRPGLSCCCFVLFCGVGKVCRFCR